jgi:D-alanyl-D-alanine carboxypeptidase
LASIGNRKNVELLQDVLPKAGAEGTVIGMLHGYGCQSRIWMKSGSMDQIQSLTGLCKAASGKWITFSIILNGFGDTHHDIRPDLEKLIEQFYRAY